MKNSLALRALLLMIFLAGCAPQNFKPVGVIDGTSVNTGESETIAASDFKVSGGQTAFQQLVQTENQTSVSFQVVESDGNLKNDLKADDLVVTESGINVSPFTLTSNSDTIVQTVDIVFAVDVTGSMTSSIESAKTRLVNFVTATRAAGYHTRMCLITFGDYTVKYCNQFYDNNPADPSTMAQVNQLISEITKLQAYKGALDPGGTDLNENPMRALIDAANAPWSPNSQRFLILMTDDGFLYSPDNSGAVGVIAPKYSEVQAALQNSQMKVFLAAPSLAGYDKPFQGQPGIVSASQGQFFLYSDLISGKITFDTILNQIISQVRTTYIAEYIADEIPGLDPSQPLAQRLDKIKVALKDATQGTVNRLGVQSNLPSGGAAYLKQWQITDKKIKDGSVHVKVNGFEIPVGFSVQAGLLIFQLPPMPGVKIEVSFDYALLKDSVLMTPIILNKNEDLSNLSVLLNGVKATNADVTFARTLDGSWSLTLTDSVVAESDPYKIRASGGLAVQILRAVQQ